MLIGKEEHYPTEVDELTEELQADGWFEVETFVPCPTPTDKERQVGDYFVVYTKPEDGKHVMSWQFKVVEAEVNRSIKLLKKELADTDYIVIKTYESFVVGLPAPYDTERLREATSRRQELRNRIGELEEYLT